MLTSADCCPSLTLASTAQVLIGPVVVKVICGDITKEKTDAIVSSTNTSLNLNSGKQFNARNIGQNIHCILPYYVSIWLAQFIISRLLMQYFSFHFF